MMGNHSLQSGPRFLNGRHGSEIDAQLASSQRSQPAVFRESGDLRQLKSTETTRVQRDTDFLWYEHTVQPSIRAKSLWTARQTEPVNVPREEGK